MPSSRTGVLLLGNYRPALAAARTLSANGYHVLMGLGGGEGCTEYSRSVDEVWDHPPLQESRADFQRALQDLLIRRTDISVVFPIGEEFVNYLADAQPLTRNLTIASPASEIVRRCRNKPAMLELARSLGVGCAPFDTASDYLELSAKAETIGYPLVIRPLKPQSRFGEKKALIVDSTAALAAVLPEWPHQQPALLLQRRAPGDRYNLFFAARSGRLHKVVQTRILRTDRPDGTGLAVDGITVAPTGQLVDDCAKLLHALNYSGVGLAQFMFDPLSGQRSFIELNPRIAGSQVITEAVRADMSLFAVQLARGLDVAEDTFEYPIGVRYTWTYGDLRGLRAALAGGELGIAGAARWLLNSLQSLVAARVHMTWSWRDPLPTVMLFGRLLPGLSRVLSEARPGLGQKRQSPAS